MRLLYGYRPKRIVDRFILTQLNSKICAATHIVEGTAINNYNAAVMVGLQLAELPYICCRYKQ